MMSAEIILYILAAMPGRRQHAGVLAGTIVMQRHRPSARCPQRARSGLVQRRMGAARQREFIQARNPQHLTRDANMALGSRMRRRG